ncbi:NAD(P)/FAD-dependent oxidoreductase [Quadrisphaera sp. KR29]|uniref:NAD(P)/FAD-dependent oxidoreductase n=1 Tax=Quadrisphaera sp. KR29 TaxID=3461391 RepID=UPI004044DC6B
MVDGEVSFWWHQLGGARARRRRPPLPPSSAPLECDVAVVGAGFTGLWTAYYLKRADPSLRVVVLEQRFAGYGASGRNGGWLTNEITGGVEGYRAGHGPAAVDAFQLAADGAVAEVVRVAEAEGIDADVHLGGEHTVARGPAQLARLRALHASMAARAGTDAVWLDAEEAHARIGVAGTRAAVWHPHCARVHPAKLVRGLAEAVERLGVEVYEGTRVTEVSPGLARTLVDGVPGRVRARVVVRATEGYTADIPALHRDWLPMNSSVVVTAPLPAPVWDAIGWGGRATLGDAAHVYAYAQRTADDRIALGGRGVPYTWGSSTARTTADGRTPARTVEGLRRVLEDFFPVLRQLTPDGRAPVEHAWSGVLAVPRDWQASVGLERAADGTALAWAGGYVGTGVTAANLAGRTLRDLVLGERTALTELPWVGHRVRRWEPEPLRWIAVHGLYAAYRAADAAEARGRRRTSPLAVLAGRVAGHR